MLITFVLSLQDTSTLLKADRFMEEQLWKVALPRPRHIWGVNWKRNWFKNVYLTGESLGDLCMRIFAAALLKTVQITLLNHSLNDSPNFLH